MYHAKSVFSWSLVVSVAVCLLTAQQKQAPPPFVPGEIVLKFASKSKAAEMVAPASEGSSQPSACLVSYIESLARDVGIPFEVKQLGSGGNLTVAIQQDDLASHLLGHLRAAPNVKAAKSLPAKGTPSTAEVVIQVDFLPHSPEAEAVAKVAASGRETGPELQPIAGSLKRETGISVTARVTSSRELLLTLDLNALTVDLAARLGKRADIEYAQPNFIRRRIGGGGQMPKPII